MKNYLTRQQINEILWVNQGFTKHSECSGAFVNGTVDWMLFGGKAYMCIVGKRAETGRPVFVTREAREEEILLFIEQHDDELRHPTQMEKNAMPNFMWHNYEEDLPSENNPEAKILTFRPR